MENVLEKISSYNIFNYLLPGALFAFALPMVTPYSIDLKNVLLAAFVCYFIGMLISRVGSLFVEPPLRKIGFLKFSNYSDFVHASAHDTKIETLSEVNNTYRTICALILSLTFVWAYSAAERRWPSMSPVTPYLLGTFVLALFLFSYRKQTAYITKRVNAHKHK